MVSPEVLGAFGIQGVGGIFTCKHYLAQRLEDMSLLDGGDLETKCESICIPLIDLISVRSRSSF